MAATDQQASAKWTAIAVACQKRAKATGMLSPLSDRLGVDIEALRRLNVGYGEFDGREAWTFPERNGEGWIVGLSLRLRNPTSRTNKVRAKGGKTGLTYALDWFLQPGPIWLVEGASDVAAGLTLGLCVIGRPSNIGGIDHLAKLLAEHTKRRIIVMGERDHKSKDDLAAKHPGHKTTCLCCQVCFPGFYGARHTCNALGDKLKRRIPFVLSPLGYKDLRDFVSVLSPSERRKYGKALQAGDVPCTVGCGAEADS